MDDIAPFWTDELTTGVEEIDNDHKALFDIFQDAYWIASTQAASEDLYIMMANLLNYTEVHFAREEALMTASPYPYPNKHSAIHQQLINQLHKQIILVKNNQQTPKGFVLLLKDWFIDHIHGVDKRIAPYTIDCSTKILEAITDAGPLSARPYSNIYLVDDDEAYINLFLALSEEAGINAIAYTSSVQFLSTAITSQDIIILDLNMPGKDGIEVMRELADRDLKPTFILVSGFDERVLQSARQFAESRQLTVANTLNKPVNANVFIDVLKHVRNDHFSNYIQTQIADFSVQSGSQAIHAPQSTTASNAITAAELKHGLENKEFIVHLQPQIKFADGSLCGVEALVRWHSPERGLVFPDQIIPFIEENDLMPELTQVVIFESIKAYNKCKLAGFDITISINISAQNIVDLRFPERLDVLLKAHNIEPEKFILELTESEILTNTSVALDIFNRLRMKGFALSIDDFGTGDSSLKKLYESPFTELKIDRHFVSRMVNDDEANSIVRICTMLANEFHMTTVAEGVETLQVWEKLKNLGCDIAQGYFISKPLPLDQFLNWANSYRPLSQ